MLLKVSILLCFVGAVCFANSNLPESQKAIVAFVTGGPIDVFSHKTAQKIFSKSKKIGDSLGISVVAKQVWFKNWRDLCDSIARREMVSHIILVGHSWGSAGAVQVASCLSSKNVKVDLVVTIDTIANAAIPNANVISNNVVANYNFYQTQDLVLRGEQKNQREDGSTQGVFNLKVLAGTLSPHTEVDNVVVPAITRLTQLLFEGVEIDGEAGLDSVRSTIGRSLN